MDDWKKNIFVDDRLESYRNFFSDDWGHRMDALVNDAATLRELVFDLMMDWRGAAYTVSFPAQMLEHFRGFAEGFANDSEPNTGILSLVDTLLAKVSRDLHELPAEPQLQRKLREKFVKVAAELKEAQDAVQQTLPVEQLWQDYLGHDVFQMTLWSSLRICYVAIYNAYDNFVGQCTSVACNGERTRTTTRDFKQKFKSAFGDPAFQRCWGNSGIHVARLARHALSHAGGRKTDALSRQSHNFRVEDGVIHVTPSDVKELYSTLKDAAFGLAEVAKHKPEFK
ncbi:MAG: hypothetical protein HQ567_04285 [Candidatus Nealsonbacteria bacterium]|nr:hypothetical protein [Candidatus Nealsonbacteria bacterium]